MEKYAVPTFHFDVITSPFLFSLIEQSHQKMESKTKPKMLGAPPIQKKGYGVPLGAEHFAARVVAGVARKEDVRLMQEEMDKEKRHEATMGLLWKSLSERRQREKREALSRHRAEMLWHASKFGDPKPFSELQARVPTMAKLITLKDSRLRTPLHFICKNGFYDCLRVCLPVPRKFFFDPSGKDYEEWRKKKVVITHTCRTRSGYTPLHFAVVGGHISCVEYLLTYFKLTDTLEEEFYIDINGRSVVALAEDYGWNGIKQLLEATMAPFFERLLLRKQRVVERDQETRRNRIEDEWRRMVDKEEEQHRKLYLLALHEMEVRREKQRSKVREKEALVQNENKDVTESHQEWVESVRKRTEALEKTKTKKRTQNATTLPSQTALTMRPETYGRGVGKPTASYLRQPLDPELVNSSRGEDWMPGDQADWKRAMEAEEAAVEDHRVQLRRLEEADKRPVMFPRLGVELSERINFGRLGMVSFGGLRVVSVKPASPAAIAGLHVDDVLHKIDDLKLTTLQDIRSYITQNAIPTGHDSPPLSIELTRGNDALQIVVQPLVTRKEGHGSSSLKVKAVGSLWTAGGEVPSVKPVRQFAAWRPGGKSIAALSNTAGEGGCPFTAARSTLLKANTSPERERPWASPPPARRGPAPLDVMYARHDVPWVA